MIIRPRHYEALDCTGVEFGKHTDHSKSTELKAALLASEILSLNPPSAAGTLFILPCFLSPASAYKRAFQVAISFRKMGPLC